MDYKKEIVEMIEKMDTVKDNTHLRMIYKIIKCVIDKQG